MKKIIILVLLSVFCLDAMSQFRRRAAGSGPENELLNYSNPRQFEVANIEVTGLNVLDKNALISLSGLRVGDMIKIPGDDISGAIRRLWKHGLVGEVNILVEKIEENKVYLLIELAERPRLTGFTFEGVKKSKETELREELNLIRGRILTDAIIRNTEMSVKNSYRKKGYLNTEVKVIQTRDTLNRDGIKLRIVVDPKAKVRIHKIEIEGNQELSDAKIKKKMKGTNEYARIALFRRAAELIAGISPKSVKEFATERKEVSKEELKEFFTDNFKPNFFNGSKYIKSDFEDDKKKIIAFYNSKGFRDADIIFDTLYAHDERSINIKLRVEEGRQYYFRDIIWTGNYIYSDEQLRRVLDIAKGDIYNKELLDKKLNFNPRGADISSLYMDDGYLFFNVDPVEIRIEGDSIDLEMRVYEGEQATINKVSIKGNDRTSDHVIRRELFTVPGAKFSRTNIIRTQQQLNNLGYFDAEKTNPNIQPNMMDGTVDIVWELEERPSDQIELSGGWGGAFGFVGTLGLVFNNFSIRNIPNVKNWRPLPVGDGQRLQIRAQANGRQFQSYTFAFTEPWLGGRKPNSFSVSLNQSIIRTRVPEFDENGNPRMLPWNQFNAMLKSQSITVGLGKRLEWPDNYFILNNSVSYLVYELDNYFGGLGFSDGRANSITYNVTLSRNSINDPMYPKSGSTISLNASFTPPYSLWRKIDYANVEAEELYKWIEYHKWMFDAKHYLPVVGKLVIETSTHFGFIGSYTNKSGVGPFERFYLGGDGLAGQNFLIGNEIIGMRGYENNVITPPNYGTSRTSLTANEIAGGIVYNKFAMELRYPVTQGAAATIYGLVFAEAGNNWNNYQDFNPFNLYRSAGVGARFFMPAFGLIGVNWGYGFDTLPGARERSGAQFHFTIGQQIR
jgi:outer membrane protein insertion porin family